MCLMRAGGVHGELDLHVCLCWTEKAKPERLCRAAFLHDPHDPTTKSPVNNTTTLGSRDQSAVTTAEYIPGFFVPRRSIFHSARKPPHPPLIPPFVEGPPHYLLAPQPPLDILYFFGEASRALNFLRKTIHTRYSLSHDF